MTTYNLDDRLAENRNVWNKYSEKITVEGVIRTLFVLALIIIAVGYFNQYGTTLSLNNVMKDFYANASSELISIVITVAILERLNSRRADKKELRRLTALLGSKKSVVTETAIAELKALGWLYDSSLNSIYLNGANLEDTNLEGANLSKVVFVGVNLSGAILNRVDMRETILRGGNLIDAQLSNANLEKLVSIRVNFADANLHLANLAGAKLVYSTFLRADLGNADLTDADLSGAILTDADLSGAELEGTQLKGADLSGADLSRANLLNAKIAHIILTEFSTLPDGRRWTKNIDLGEYTDAKHPNYQVILDMINKVR